MCPGEPLPEGVIVVPGRMTSVTLQVSFGEGSTPANGRRRPGRRQLHPGGIVECMGLLVYDQY